MKLSQIYTSVSLKLQLSQPHRLAVLFWVFFLGKSGFHNETLEDLMKKKFISLLC